MQTAKNINKMPNYFQTKTKKKKRMNLLIDTIKHIYIYASSAQYIGIDKTLENSTSARAKIIGNMCLVSLLLSYTALAR